MRLLCSVNGESVDLEVSPTVTLLELLRKNLGLIGVREGCAMGECGACTVLLNGRPVPACLVIAADLQGSEILTVEGIVKTQKGRELAEAFVNKGAVQCGFCTTGFIAAAYALLETEPDPDRRKILDAVEGHICRCTGYKKILDAIECASSSGKEK